MICEASDDAGRGDLTPLFARAGLAPEPAVLGLA
jgi:hypothetical protein